MDTLTLLDLVDAIKKTELGNISLNLFPGVVLRTTYCENNESYIRKVLWLIWLSLEVKNYSGFENNLVEKKLKYYYIFQNGEPSI